MKIHVNKYYFFFGFEGFLSNDVEENEGEMLRFIVSMLYVNVTHGTHKTRDNPSFKLTLCSKVSLGRSTWMMEVIREICLAGYSCFFLKTEVKTKKIRCFF